MLPTIRITVAICTYRLDDRLAVGEDFERYLLLELDILEFQNCSRFWQGVNCGGKTILVAKQLVTIEGLLSFEVTEAGFAKVFLLLMIGYIEEQTSKVLNPSIMTIEVEEVH